MPTLNIYEQQDFPSIYKWQAIAFFRCEWTSLFQGKNLYMSETYPPALDPVHFVIAEGDSLLSYATLLKLHLSHVDQEYFVYRFGNMFTFAPYRKQGHGRNILRTATEFIRQSPVDVAILFCDKRLKGYYAAEGWLAIHSPTYLGRPEDRVTHEPLRMMLLLSEKGNAARADFENSPLFVDSPW